MARPKWITIAKEVSRTSEEDPDDFNWAEDLVPLLKRNHAVIKNLPSRVIKTLWREKAYECPLTFPGFCGKHHKTYGDDAGPSVKKALNGFSAAQRYYIETAMFILVWMEAAERQVLWIKNPLRFYLLLLNFEEVSLGRGDGKKPWGPAPRF